MKNPKLHDEFKAWVAQRRGKRLKAPDDVLFSGDIWIGAQAVELGVVGQELVGDVRG